LYARERDGASPHELLATSCALLDAMDITDTLHVPREVVQAFLVATQAGYLPTPFHNFSHAVYVLHGCVMCLRQCPLLHELLSPVEKLALCIAALGHDIGHMGVQNGFLINSNDPLALQYNDRSVLESYHCSRLFAVLRMKQCALLDGLTADEYRAVRKIIIGMVLATDLSQHFDDMTRFKTRLQNDKPWSAEAMEDKKMAAEMVLHAADLSGPARPWVVSHAWSTKVQEEFVAQVASEKRLGLPVSHFLTAEKAKLEVGFIDLFANPVWDALGQLLPQVSDRVATLHDNYERWTQQLEGQSGQ